MRISDWSSDVCSSDLSVFMDVELWSETDKGRLWSCPFLAAVWQLARLGLLRHLGEPVLAPRPWTGRAFPQDWDDRKSVVSGKSVSVRVDIGGRRILKKKT